MGPPVDQGFETSVGIRKGLDHRAQLVLGYKEDAGLRVVDDELYCILAQGVIQGHAVDGLPVACLQRAACLVTLER